MKSRPRTRPVCRGPIAVLLALVVALAACAGSSSLSDELVSRLDVTGESLAVVGDTLSEPIPTNEILQAVAAARGAGTDLRVVIAGDDLDLVDPKAVADRYGGTVLSYKTGEPNFRAASRDIDDAQLNRARDAAQVSDIGGSVTAFVRQLEDEGGVVAKGANGLRWLLWVALALCAAVFLWQLSRFIKARSRNRRLARSFAERQAALNEWVASLRPEIGRIEPFSTRLDASQLRQLEESRDLLDSVGTSIGRATTLPELDAAEMRISRTAIKLRDLRRAVDI